MLLDCCAANSPMSSPSKLSMEPSWPISMAGKDGGRSLELRLSACRAWLWYGICICTGDQRSQACDRLRAFKNTWLAVILHSLRSSPKLRVRWHRIASCRCGQAGTGASALGPLRHLLGAKSAAVEARRELGARLLAERRVHGAPAALRAGAQALAQLLLVRLRLKAAVPGPQAVLLGLNLCQGTTQISALLHSAPAHELPSEQLMLENDRFQQSSPWMGHHDGQVLPEAGG